MSDSLYDQIADVEELIDLEKSRARLHSSAPSGIDPTPKASMESRRLMAELLGNRGSSASPDAYQGSTPDWRANQSTLDQARRFQEIARDTAISRTREELYSPSSYSTSSPQQELLRQRTNTLDALREVNAARGVPDYPNGTRPTSVDNTPALRNPTTSGQRAPLRATDPPRSALPSTWRNPAPTIEAELPTPMNQPRPLAATRPSGLPSPVGLPRAQIAAGAIGAGIDFGLRVASGQDARSAAFSAGGSLVGSLAGAALGSALGPIGTFAGGMVGGYIGGALGSALGNSLFPPSGGRSPDSMTSGGYPSDSGVLPVLPFLGGQSANVSYNVIIAYSWVAFYTVSGQDRDFSGTKARTYLGRINSINTVREGTSGAYIRCVFASGSSTEDIVISGDNAQNTNLRFSITNISITRADGQPDTGGNLNPLTLPPPVQPAPNNRLVYPGAGTPHPLNSPTTNYAPNTTPAPGGTPAGNSPFWIPAARPNPSGSPAGASNLGGNLPEPTPARIPDQALPERSNPSFRALSPPIRSATIGGAGRMGESLADYQDRMLAGENSSQLSGDLTPLISAAIPIAVLGMNASNLPPTGLRPGAPVDATPGTGNPTAPQPQPSTTTPIGTGTDTGTSLQCRFRDDPYSPGIDARTTEMKAVELAIQNFQNTMLTKLDEKLGPQLPGGVSGKLGRLGQLAAKTYNFLQVDRVLNVLSWLGIVHNAYMLSNNIAQTLFSAIGSTLDAFGIQKVDDEGNEEPFDIGEMVNDWAEDRMKQIFGVDTWEGIKSTWKKANRIYQAASNLLFSIQSMNYAILEGIETASNYIAKIGNAARIYGVFTEKVFNPMRDNLNLKGGRFFRFLDNSQEFIENIDSISSNVVDAQQTAADCFDQKQELQTALTDFENTRKTEEQTKKANSQGATINPSDERKPES